MLSRLVRTSFGRTSTFVRYYSASQTGGKKPTITPENNTKLSSKEEADLFLDTSSPQFKELIKQSKQQYKDVLKQVVETQAENKVIGGVTIKPKIYISTTSGKFAHSLFDIASQMKSISIVSKDVTILLKTINSIPDFQTVIEGDVSVDEKIYALNLLTKSVKLTPITQFYVYYMTYEQKFNQFVQSLKDFQRLAESLSSEMDVRLTIAKEYSAKEKKDLEDQIKSYFPADTAFKFKYAVDPAIKGGYIIESSLLNHNASLAKAVDIVQQEEKTILAELLSDVKKSVREGTEFWNSQEFKDKYLKFDLKAYEAKVKQDNI